MDADHAGVFDDGDEFHQANAGVPPEQGDKPGEFGQGSWLTEDAAVPGGHGAVNGTVPLAPNGSANSRGPAHAGAAAAREEPAASSRSAAGKPSVLGEATASIAALGLEFPQVAAPAHGPARWVRVLTGVDERLLDRVWEERARYTGLGAIVLGTATMATLSILDALDQI